MDKRQAIIDELPRLRRYARALARDASAADDLVQDCVERALSRLALFRAGTNMRSWLFTIMHNVHVNTVRRRFRAPDTEPLVPGHEARHAQEPPQPAAIAARDFAGALGKLSDDHRQILLLVGLEDMSYRETAAVLGVPVGTVMSRLARGRRRLRSLMEESEPVIRRVK